MTTGLTPQRQPLRVALVGGTHEARRRVADAVSGAQWGVGEILPFDDPSELPDPDGRGLQAVLLLVGIGDAPASLIGRVREAAPGAAVLVLSDAGGGAEAVEWVTAGAQDVLPLDDIERLGPALHYAVQRQQRIQALERRLKDLESTEARFQTMIEHNADGIVIVDADGVLRYANPAAERLFRRPAGELVGGPFGLPLVIDDTAELDVVRPGGETVVAELRAVAIEWGGESACLVSLREITDRKESEERRQSLIREQEARLQAEAEQRRSRFLADASELLDASLDYTETLRNLSRLLVPQLGDWCAIDVIEDGQPALRLVASRDPGAAELARELERSYPLDHDSEQPAARVLRSGKEILLSDVGEEELRVAAPDPRHRELVGALGIAALLAVPLVARSRTIGVITLVKGVPGADFTAADVLLARELARRAAISVDNARLYRDASIASRAKSDFLAVISHELRTPLNSIMGYVSILQQEIPGPVNDAQREKLSRVDVSSRHLLNLIEEILTFSRIEAGRDSVRPDTFELRELLQDVAGVAKPLARERNLEFRVDGPEGPATLHTDPGKVRQILLNLLTNAIKYTDRGWVRLSGSLDGSLAVLQVVDSGRGIAPEHQDRIFQTFWQAEQPSTRSEGGTGLGLSVSRQLAHALGGDISVHSEPGRGSRFTLRIPHHLER